MFNAIAQPFGWLLMTIYDFVNSYALALLLIAVIVKIILLPFQMKAKRGQLKQTRLQPKLAELQKRHAANKQKLNEEMSKLYKEEGINPASGCLWSFIQMPIMIAMFFAIRQPLTLMMGVSRELLEEGGAIYNKLAEMNFVSTMSEYYIEIAQAQFISDHFSVFAPLSEHLQQISFYLGNFLNLGEQPHWDFFWRPETDWSNSAIWLPGLILFFFPFISGGAQFLSMGIMRKMSTTGSPEAMAGAAGTILKFMPLMSVWFGFIFPAALSLYWTIGTVLQLGQDIWLTKKYTKILDEEDAEKEIIRKAKEAEIEAKRLETERKKAEGLAERNSNTSKRKKKKGDKQDKREKAAEWEKTNTPVVEKDEEDEPSRVGKRRYARGRAYDPDRFSDGTDGDSAVSEGNDDALDLTDEDIEVDGVAVDKKDESGPNDYAEAENELIDDSGEDFEEDEDSDSDDDSDDDDIDDDEDEVTDDDLDEESDSDEDDDAGDGEDAEDDEGADDDEDDENNSSDNGDDSSEALNTEKFDTKRFD